MGRKRIHQDPLKPLPRGLVAAGRKFRARADSKSPWHYFDGPYEHACEAFRAWRGDGVDTRSLVWLLDQYLQVYARITVAPRTYRDYCTDAETLKSAMGHIPADALTSAHVADYRDVRMEDAPGHINKELAVIYNAYRWGMERGYVQHNPATTEAVRRASNKVRTRLITDAEFLAVYNISTAQEKLAMQLDLRTLQRPADVLKMCPRDVVNGRLRVVQNKTKAVIFIQLEGALAQLIDESDARDLQPFVRTREGKRYTVSGMGAMFRRHCLKAGVKDYGRRDHRAKGATDMYNAGIPISEIQALLGHTTEAQTRKYLKQLQPPTVRANLRAVIA